jgi:hypothetical protein
MADEGDREITLFVLGLVLGMILATAIGLNLYKSAWQRDAVTSGHAEWVADKDGDARWQWKTMSPGTAPAKASAGEVEKNARP